MITISVGQTAPSLMGRRTNSGGYEISVKKNGHGGEITLRPEEVKMLIFDMVASL